MLSRAPLGTVKLRKCSLQALPVEVARHQDHLLVAEPHLAAGVPRNVDTTQKYLFLVLGALW